MSVIVHAERKAKRLIFVQDVLRSFDGWVLVYDNVDRYGDFLKYLPQAKCMGKRASHSHHTKCPAKERRREDLNLRRFNSR